MSTTFKLREIIKYFTNSGKTITKIVIFSYYKSLQKMSPDIFLKIKASDVLLQNLEEIITV